MNLGTRVHLNKDQWLSYLKHCDQLAKNHNYQSKHDWPSFEGFREPFPCITLTAINYDYTTTPATSIFTHAFIEKTQILRVLGLTTEELNIELAPLSILDTIPSEVEQREI